MASRAVLKKKLAKVTSLRTDSPEILQALGSLASFYDPQGNTLEARRMLRADLERNGLLLAEEFVRKFEGVEEQLNEVSTCLREMSDEAEVARDRAVTTSRVSRALLARYADMTAERTALSQRQTMLSSFVDRFQLSQKHRHALYRGPIDAPEPSDEEKAAGGASFFGVLEHIDEVRTDCARLLTSQHQRVGLEILQEMARHQSSAFERLFQWSLRTVRSLGQLTDAGLIFDAADAVPVTLPRAIHALRARPAFQAACCELLTDVRRKSIAQRFNRALTVGGPNGTPRPIALQSHDPLRYVGDMLAWTHQAIANEMDLLNHVFASFEPADFDRLLQESDVDAAAIEAETAAEVVEPDSGQRHRISWRADAVARIFNALEEPLLSRINEVTLLGMVSPNIDDAVVVRSGSSHATEHVPLRYIIVVVVCVCVYVHVLSLLLLLFFLNNVDAFFFFFFFFFFLQASYATSLSMASQLCLGQVLW